jgi:UDPglucose 6-dehydrogenase
MACDLSYLESATKKIRDVSKKYIVIVEKSTVPVGTGVHIQDILNSNTYGIKYDVISNPEFLAEGTAIADLENPHRVLIGCNPSDTSKYAMDEIIDIYNHWVSPDKIIPTDRWSSELSKLSSNAFLAQRVSSINVMSMVCEEIGGNILDISKILGMDQRIGKYFLNSSVGFGGSCFKKDILDLVYLCDYYNLHEVSMYWWAVIEINELQKKRFSKNILHTLYDSIKNKHIAIFGFSFKKNSSDTRETPSISICNYLINEGAILHIYDPKVPRRKIYEELNIDESNSHVIVVSDCYKACEKVEAIALLTGWDIFKSLDYERIFKSMDHPSYIFDGCNVLDKKILEEYGFRVYVLGHYKNIGAV